METIKKKTVSGQPRIITKNGKISCSCCEVIPIDCCMYSAEGFGVLYTEVDLPDEIEVFIDYFLNRGIAPRSGARYLFDYTDDSAIIRTAEIVIDTFGSERLWVIREVGTSGIDAASFCLIDEGLDDLGTSDLFEFTYKITHSTGSGTVNRTSQCQWLGTDDNGQELELFFNSSFQKWRVKYTFFDPPFSGVIRVTKQVRQNTPLGSYENDSGGSATVSLP